MTRLFENDDVILEKDENNEYRLSFLKDGHSKSEEHYPFMALLLGQIVFLIVVFLVSIGKARKDGPRGICDASRRWPRYTLYRKNGTYLC